MHASEGEVISGHQRQSDVIIGHQRSSEVIIGQHRSSEVIRGLRVTQRSSSHLHARLRARDVALELSSSEVIRGHQRSSSHLHARLRARDVALELSNRLLRARVLGRHRGGGAQSPLELADLDAARLELSLRLLERLLGGQPACEKRMSSQSGAISVTSTCHQRPSVAIRGTHLAPLADEMTLRLWPVPQHH